MIRRLVFTCCLLAGGASTAHALVVHDTLGPGDSYSCCSGWFVDSDYMQAFQFTASDSGLLSSIDLAVGYNERGGAAGDIMSLSIWTDAGGAVGSLLEGDIDAVMTEVFGIGSVATAFAAGTTNLLAGASYWLMAASTGSGSLHQNDLGISGNRYLEFSGGFTLYDTIETAAFRINVTAVPEPGSLLLLGSGLFGMGAMRRRLTANSSS